MLSKISVKARSGHAQVTLWRPHSRRTAVDGYDLLVERICQLAATDLKGRNRYNKFDAMDFFRSSWFERLTGLDGEEIIQELLKA